MGEDIPVENPDERRPAEETNENIGETALEGSAEPQAVNEGAPAEASDEPNSPDTELPEDHTIDHDDEILTPDSKKWEPVQDVDKAWEMAKAGDESRTKAVENRNVDKMFGDSTELFRQSLQLKNSGERPPVWRRGAVKDFEKDQAEREEQSKELNDKSKQLHDRARLEDVKAMARADYDFPSQSVYKSPASIRERAYDNRAETMERAAGREYDYAERAEEQDSEHDVDKAWGMTKAGDESRTEDEGREKDVDKAWDQAIAGDESRTKAALSREIDNGFKRRRDLTMQADTLINKKHPGENGINGYKGGDPETDELIDEVNTSWENSDIAESKRGNVGEDFPNQDVASYARAAEAYDKRADKLEEWAGVLHDKPVNDAYKEAHPGVEITPASMLAMEQSVEKDLKEMKTLTANKDSLRLDFKAAQQGPGKSPEKVWPEFNEIINGNKEVGERYRNITEKISSATYEYDTSITDLYDEVKIRPLRNELALKQAFLDDVRSGRASEFAPARKDI